MNFQALLLERSFNAAGSLVVIATLLIPFIFAWLLSIYENRLLYYFSEGRQVFTKGNIIASVISAAIIPYFLASFGLLAVSAILGESIVVPALADGEFPRPTSEQALLYIPLTMALAMGSVALIHRRIVAHKLPDSPGVQRLFNRWVLILAVISQVLILGFLWAVLYFFPAEANTQIN